MESKRWRRRVSVGILGVVLAGCGSVVRDQTTGEFLDDSVITTRVKARLAQEPGVSSLAISVDTYDRLVILRGFVDREAQREKAIDAARSVGGVREVNGEALIVKPQRPGS